MGPIHHERARRLFIFATLFAGVMAATTAPARADATLFLGVYPPLLFEVAEASARTLGAGGIAAVIR